MSKKFKIIILVLLVVLIAAGLYFFLIKKSQKDIAADNSKKIPQGTVQKPIVFETPTFMTLEEKQEKKVNPNLRIQVLKRDETGKIVVYKIIKSDADIVKEYFEPHAPINVAPPAPLQ